MQQAILTRQDLYEGSESNNRTNLTVVNLANLRDRYDTLDSSQGCIQSILVLTEDINITFIILFGDGNGCTGLFLDLLDHLTARADHSTDELLRNRDLNDARYERFVISSRFRYRLKNLAENVHTALFCLFEGFCQHFV